MPPCTLASSFENKQTNNPIGQDSSEESKVVADPKFFVLCVLAEIRSGSQTASLSPSDFPRRARMTPRPHFTGVRDQAYLTLSESTHCKTRVFIRMHSTASTGNPMQNGLFIKEMHLLIHSEVQRRCGGSIRHIFSFK